MARRAAKRKVRHGIAIKRNAYNYYRTKKHMSPKKARYLAGVVVYKAIQLKHRRRRR